MKKIFYISLIALAATTSLNAQSLLDRAKAKAAKALEGKQPEKPAEPTNSTSPSSDIQYTDPSKYGTLIYTFSSKDIADHQGTYNEWFTYVKVTNNQLDCKINDYATVLGTYTNGQFTKSSGDADVNHQNAIANGSDLEFKQKDFSQIDMMNSLLKKGPSVAGARVPGKIGLTYTFKGKPVGEYMSASLVHNPDSSAIALVGQGFAAGAMKMTLALSSGAKVDLPVKITGQALLSPDGKAGAAVVLQSLTGAGADVYTTAGGKFTIGNYDSNYGLWMHNSGAVYNVNAADNKELFKNGQSFIKSNFQLDSRVLFINSNDNTACWSANRGLWFSDGTKFENGECPHKVTINNKEVIVFLAVDLQSGKLYLCQHDL